MKKRILFVVFIVFAMMVGMTGCDKIKGMLGMGGTQPVQVGPGGMAPGTQPTGPDGQPLIGSPGMTPPRPLNCCMITNFKIGKMKDDGSDNLVVYEETTNIPYVPGTYFGISFDYKSSTGKPIVYYEEEFFPYPPQNWTLWEGSEGSYKTFPAENRAVYTTNLTSDKDTFASYWGFNPSGDPTGQWHWNISFDNEFYTTVIFNVTPSTY